MSTQKLISAAEFRRLIHESADELAWGALVPRPLYLPRQSTTCKLLQKTLSDWACDQQTGYVLSDGVGLLTRCHPDTIRRPAVVYYNHSAWPGLAALAEWLSDPPTVVCEVDDAASAVGSAVERVTEYLEWGVEEVWRFDCEAQTLTVHGHQQVQRFTSAQPFHSAAASGMQFDVGELFG